MGRLQRHREPLAEGEQDSPSPKRPYDVRHREADIRGLRVNATIASSAALPSQGSQRLDQRRRWVANCQDDGLLEVGGDLCLPRLDWVEAHLTLLTPVVGHHA